MERTPEDVRAFIQRFLDHQKQDPRIRFQLAVTLKPTGQLIGSCGVRRNSAEAFEGDMRHELDPDHWGRGYATDAARAVLRFGSSDMGLHRISAACVADNTGSAHVPAKSGMQQEGWLRENESDKGRGWDTLPSAILYEEWQALHNGLSPD